MGLTVLEDRSPKHSILFPFKGIPGKLKTNKQGVIIVKTVPEILTVVQKSLNIVLFSIYFSFFPKLKNRF